MNTCKRDVRLDVTISCAQDDDNHFCDDHGYEQDRNDQWRYSLLSIFSMRYLTNEMVISREFVMIIIVNITSDNDDHPSVSLLKDNLQIEFVISCVFDHSREYNISDQFYD